MDDWFSLTGPPSWVIGIAAVPGLGQKVAVAYAGISTIWQFGRWMGWV